MRESFTPEPEPSKMSRLGDVAVTGSVLSAMIALTYSYIKDPLRNPEEPRKPTAEVIEKKINDVTFDVKHIQILSPEQEPEITINQDTSEKVAQPKKPYRFEYDREHIEYLQEGVRNRSLNFITKSKTAEEIDALYADMETRLEAIAENRKEIESLHFHTLNDPRIMSVYAQVAKVMGIDHPHIDDVSIKLISVGAEAAQKTPFQAMTRFDDDALGQIYLDSHTVLGMLKMGGANYVLACDTFANEACHRFRGEQYGSAEKYFKAYTDSWPESSITSSGLPSEVTAYYDTWYAKYYSKKVGTASERIEKESFYVAYLLARDIIQNGVTIKLDTEAATAIHWTESSTR